jgi:hypothetical protein
MRATPNISGPGSNDRRMPERASDYSLRELLIPDLKTAPELILL